MSHTEHTTGLTRRRHRQREDHTKDEHDGEKEERTGHTFNVNFSTIKQCLREKQTTEHGDTELEVE